MQPRPCAGVLDQCARSSASYWGSEGSVGGLERSGARQVRKLTAHRAHRGAQTCEARKLDPGLRAAPPAALRTFRALGSEPINPGTSRSRAPWPFLQWQPRDGAGSVQGAACRPPALEPDLEGGSSAPETHQADGQAAEPPMTLPSTCPVQGFCADLRVQLWGSGNDAIAGSHHTDF